VSDLGFRDIRVIIASSDNQFYRMVEERLRMESIIESVSNVVGLLSVPSMLSVQVSNVLLVDLDYVSATEAYLRQLSERSSVLTVLISQSPHKAAVFKDAGNRVFVQKPRVLASAFLSPFITSVMSKASDFGKSMPHLNYSGMQRTVDANQKIVVVASSTGGTEVVERILKALPKDIPPILLVQHMPSGFTKFFATRLDSICPMEVHEAKDNDYLKKGLVLIAPADKHMRLVRRGSKLMVECYAGHKIHGVMPAADVLFESVAPIMRKNAIGVILTGMGADGARGLLLMHNHGAKTIGQNKESCVVYGMPKVAHDLGALDVQVHIDKIAETIMKYL
jgi:two-component system chemotaxis response regulator CheB